MSETLTSRIADDTKAAMKAQDKPRLGVMRLIGAAIKQVEVDERRTLSDDDVLGILEKMLKQRRESLSQFEQASRADLAEQESYEISIIETYMPEALSAAEVSALVDEAIESCGASSVKDMGKVMASLKPVMKGRADMRQVSELVKAKLG